MKKLAMILATGLLISAGSVSATDLQNIETIQPLAGENIGINGTLNLANGTGSSVSIINPALVNGVDLDNPGNALVINSNQYEVKQDSLTMEEILNSSLNQKYVNRAGDTMKGDLGLSGNDLDSIANIYSDGAQTNFFGGCPSGQYIEKIGSDGSVTCVKDNDVDEKVGVDSGAAPGYLGSGGSSGVLRANTPIVYNDNGDFVSLGLDWSAADDLDAGGNVIAFDQAGDLKTSGDIVDGNVENAELANSAITVNSGNQLTGGGTVSLGNSTTLDVLEGAGSGLNADKLDGVQLANINWSDIALAKDDVSKTDVELGNVRNVDLANTDGDFLIYNTTNEKYNVLASNMNWADLGISQSDVAVSDLGQADANLDMNRYQVQNVVSDSAGDAVNQSWVKDQVNTVADDQDLSADNGTTPPGASTVKQEIKITNGNNTQIKDYYIEQKKAQKDLLTGSGLNGGENNVLVGSDSNLEIKISSTAAGNELSLSAGSLNVDEGAGSGLNADQLDGVQLANIDWSDTALKQTEVNVSDLGPADANLDMNSQEIQGASRVGIGTSSPTQSLDVDGTASITNSGTTMKVDGSGNVVINLG